MSQHQLDEERIFHVARSLDDSKLRQEYLAQVCADDQSLRERVEELLEVHEKEQSFLKSQPGNVPTEFHTSMTEAVGQQIGRYKLLQKIGEGGFGVVYMAEQSLPVRRKVALKVIKPGMDTAAVIARFEAERQALALMDHPNIARVFDGGATESGRPYFVMELVKGVPVTEFCDENKLAIRERLELFATICRAIQHAHQKGIIHRDIKPSNVLITLHDGKPVPKVIDFGVSKAISQQLTEKTLFTAHGQMIGTPQYMSPEQAELSGLDIDTRSDIYSLGILLYELLTGVTPLDPERIRSSAFAELQRLIREDEPVQPSRRCSTLGKQSANIAAQRKTDPIKLGLLLRGELDWIVMKTLEKDRNRRYETPNSLAKDVENYLNDETVAACPPSLAYRLQKLARRHKSLLMTGGTIALLLLVATIVSTSLYFDARIARNDAVLEKEKADQERIKAESLLRENSLLNRQQTLGTALSLAASDQEESALQVIEAASLASEDKVELTAILYAERKNGEGDPRGSIKILQGLKSSDNDIIIRTMLANAYMDAGDFWSFKDFPEVEGKIDPITPYEHLFVGKAEFWLDFQRSIEHLNVAAALTPSPLSFSFRARSLALRAAATRASDPEGSLELIDQAVEDIDIATRLFQIRSPGSAAPQIRSDVLGWHLLTLTHAINIYQLHESEKANQVRAAANELVRELKQGQIDNLGYVQSFIGFYHHFHADYLTGQGQLAEAEEERQEAKKYLLNSPFGPCTVLVELLRLDPGETEDYAEKRQELLDELLRFRNLGLRPNLMQAYHDLLSNDADSGRRKVADLIAELKQQPLTRQQVTELCQMYLLLGDIPALREFAQQQTSGKVLARDLPSELQGLAFYTGELEAEGYLKNRENSGSTTYRLFIIGLSELGRGNSDGRKEALRRFEEVGSEGLFHSTEFFIAAAFAERMKRDETWPPWLVSKAVGSGN